MTKDEGLEIFLDGLDIGDWISETGYRRLEIGDERLETRDRGSEIREQIAVNPSKSQKVTGLISQQGILVDILTYRPID